nr:MAG TPA: hypothetical protein [Caudoviricetes sp.]
MLLKEWIISPQHRAEKQALVKAIGNVVVTHLRPSVSGPTSFPHCQIPIAIYLPVLLPVIFISKPVFVIL